MAFQKKNTSGNANANLFPFTFVNYVLTTEQIDLMDAFLEMKRPSLETMLEALCEENYKVAVAIDFKNEAFVCRVTGAEGNVNFNLCMSSHAGSIFDAVLIAWWKVFEIFGNGRWEVEDKPKKTPRG